MRQQTRPGGRPVPRRRAESMHALFCRKAMRPMVGLYRVPRLQGTAALQVREGPLEL